MTNSCYSQHFASSQTGQGMTIQAVQHIRPMRGGSQSKLMRAAEGSLWVVKFRNNPQHLRILANEMIVTRLAKTIGLSMPETAAMEVSPLLCALSPDLQVNVGRSRVEPCSAGLNFGSRLVGDGDERCHTVDYLPQQWLSEVQNLAEFAGILAVDKWTCNCDSRQAVFSRGKKQKCYTATFIDQGFCFNAGEWRFPDAPLRGVYPREEVYANIEGWHSFSPWLERLEEMQQETVWEIVQSVPVEWYGGDTDALERLVAKLLARRSCIRENILELKRSDRNPFPKWTAKTA